MISVSEANNGQSVILTTHASLRPSSYPAHIISGKILKSIPLVLCHISHSSLSIMGTSTFCSNRVPYLLPSIGKQRRETLSLKSYRRSHLNIESSLTERRICFAPTGDDPIPGKRQTLLTRIVFSVCVSALFATLRHTFPLSNTISI